MHAHDTLPTTPVIDAHCDTLHNVLDGKGTLGDGIPKGHVDLPRLRAGGVHVQVFACWVPVPYQRSGATAYALRLIETFHRQVAAYPHLMLHVRTAEDVARAVQEGKVGGILSLEGAEPLEGHPETLGAFYRLGVRWLGLTWNYRNHVADGVADERSQGGLTPFGVDVVHACGELGIVVDVSHLSPAGVEDVLNVARGPVVASHSNARTLRDHRRNLTDDQARGIAATGGVIGVTFVPSFLTDTPETASIEHVLDHIEHFVGVVGVEHVGVGSDFDGIGDTVPPRGLEDVSRYGNLRAGLLRRGFSEADVAAILGGNWWRVLQQVLTRDAGAGAP